MSAVMELPVRYRGVLRFDIASRADRCVNWLKVNGFEVLSVESGPRITIKRSPLCDKLEGVVEGYSRTLFGETRYQMVNRWDCAVVWHLPSSRPDNAVVSLWKSFMRMIGGRS
jgi:hypothetical protein